MSQAAHKEEAPNTGPEPFSRHKRSTDLKNYRGMSSSAAHRLEIPVRTAGLVISKSMPSARQRQYKAGGLPERWYIRGFQRVHREANAMSSRDREQLCCE